MSARLIEAMKGCLQCGTDLRDVVDYIEQEWKLRLFDKKSSCIVAVELITKFCTDECIEAFMKNSDLQHGIEEEVLDYFREKHQ